MLSFNGKFGLHRDWTARSQYVMDWIDGEMHWAYHTSMDWRNESGWSGHVRLEEIQDGFRPNETGFEDEAFRKTFNRLGYRYRFAKDNLVRSFNVSAYHLYQTNAEKLLRTRRIGWSTSIDIGPFDFDVYGGNGAQRVDKRFNDEVGYNFNSIFDYQFTPESHFFFVFVDGTAGDRAVFTKLSYLFESGSPF